MKIELNIGDTFIIPTGCKATIKDNKIVIEKEQEEFKDGDILHSINTSRILIFKKYNRDSKHVFSCYFSNTNEPISDDWFTAKFRHATKEEKRAFFDNLKEKGLRWNSETKTIEKVRKRAKVGGSYLFINSLSEVTCADDDYNDYGDNTHWGLGNYYLPNEKEQAKEDAKAIRAIFEKRIRIR